MVSQGVVLEVFVQRAEGHNPVVIIVNTQVNIKTSIRWGLELQFTRLPAIHRPLKYLMIFYHLK